MCVLATLFQPERLFCPKLLDGIETDLHDSGPDSGGQCSEAGFGNQTSFFSVMPVVYQSFTL